MMAEVEEAIAAIEESINRKVEALTLNEVLNDDRYDLLQTVYDPVHGSYIIMAERDPKLALGVATREMGYSSPSPFTAWTREERVAELRDKLGIRKYYDMKRADGTVRGA